jgi:hypothetical protein
MKTATLLLVAAGLLFGTTVSLSQDKTPRVDRREARQQKRIEKGVKSGELTPREAGRLEAREAKIQNDEARAKADGKVTKVERKKLNRELNRTSRAIYRQKHDAQKSVNK